MDKMRDYGVYIDTVKKRSAFFKKYYYHALIDLNLAKLDSILKYGILSKNLIEQDNLISLYTHDARDYDSKNGNTYISLTEYRPDLEFNILFESFPLHTLTSLSLLVSRDVEVFKEGERETFFDDEVFCLNSISKEYLEGIMLPEHLSNLFIRDVNPLPNDYSCYTKTFLAHWIFCMEKYFDRAFKKEWVQEIRISQKQLFDILEKYENPYRWVQSAIGDQRDKYGRDLKDVLANILEYLWEEKYSISEPTFMDILKRVNDNRLPIYELKEKGLKRIV